MTRSASIDHQLDSDEWEVSLYEDLVVAGFAMAQDIPSALVKANRWVTEGELVE